MEKRPGGSARDGSNLAGVAARLEERLASATSAHDTITRSNLARLKDLESRMGELEGASAAVPAAPAP
jgi:hypothetical protein